MPPQRTSNRGVFDSSVEGSIWIEKIAVIFVGFLIYVAHFSIFMVFIHLWYHPLQLRSWLASQLVRLRSWLASWPSSSLLPLAFLRL